MVAASMNICLITSYEGISAYTLSKVLPELSDHNLTVFYSQKVKKNLPEKLREISQADQALLRKHEHVFISHKASKLNRINTDDFEKFRQTAPDLVISLRHMSILQDHVIAVPRYGVLNLHSGALPSYRGVMATFWSMNNREETIASTLHRIEDSKIDKGSIISSAEVSVDYSDSYYGNLIRLYDQGYHQIIDAVNTIQSHSTIPSSPMAEGGAYYSWPSEENLKELPFALA